MRKTVKYISIVLAGLLLLIVVLLLLTQTAFFRAKLKDRLVAEAEKSMNLHIEIGDLNGNLFKRIEITDLRATQSETEIAKFSEVQLEYHLLPLISGELLIDSIIINEPKISIWQNKDSTWSFASYLKSSPALEEPKEKKPMSLQIHLKKLVVNNGNFAVEALEELIPKKVNNLNLELGADILGPKINVDLNRLNFTTTEPALVLNELSGIYRMNEEAISIDSLKIRTNESVLKADAKYHTLENMNAQVVAAPIANNELEIFVPEIKLLCSPTVSASLKTVDDKLSARVELKHDNEEVIAQINLDNFSELFEKKKTVPYSADLSFHQFVVEHWLEVENIETLLEGNVKLDGRNIYDPNASTKITANLKNSAYNGVNFDTFKMAGNWHKDSVKGRLELSSDFGKMSAEGTVWHISSSQDYSLDLLVDQFNLTAFYPEIERTIINGNIKADGHGFDLNKIATTASLKLTGSEIYTFPVDSLSSSLSLQNKTILVDTVEIFAPGARATGSGSLNIDSLYLVTRLNAQIDSLALIKHLVQLPVSFDSAQTISQIRGPVNRLEMTGQVDLYNAKGYNAFLGNTKANYRVNVIPDSLKVMVKSQSRKVEYSGIPLDSVSVNMEYMNNQLDLTGHVAVQDTLDVNVRAGVTIGDTMVLDISQFEVNTLLSDYYLNDTLSATMFGTDHLEVKNLDLLDKNDPEFLLSANGLVSANDTNAFRLLVKKFDLKSLNRFITINDSIKGILDTEVTLKGTVNNPVVDGRVEILEPAYSKYSFYSLIANLSYKDQIGKAELKIPDFGDSFSASATAAFDAYLDSFKFVFSEPDTFNVELSFDDFKISRHVKNFIENDTISGVLNAKLRATGSYKNPQIYGNIDLSHVRYLNSNMGLDFQDLETSLNFDGNKVNIDTIFIRQKKGFVSISGNLEFDSTIVTGNIISSTVEADAENFLIAKNRSYEVLFDANTFLNTGAENPEFGGKIKVLRSDVYLPAILSREMSGSDEDIPMLVEALGPVNDTLTVNENKKMDKKENTLSILDQITGRMNVEIPRNTWLRSNDMRVELSGDVDVVKSGSYFELFGEIKLIRGHYILYGKKLNIKTSRIIFNGGEELDPTLDFMAEYVFRSQDREKRYLELLLTGTLEEPEITFKLDDEEITENDGVSVLLFGSTADEIGFGEQNGIIGSIGSNAVASLISSQLSRTIGTQLNLDMIEVTATENWKSAAFVVGKYITNDIFVIYERGFGEVEGDEIVPETFTVEYELNDKLFLRLQSGSSITSGVDVILKFEQEQKKQP